MLRLGTLPGAASIRPETRRLRAVEAAIELADDLNIVRRLKHTSAPSRRAITSIACVFDRPTFHPRGGGGGLIGLPRWSRRLLDALDDGSAQVF
jgi:hypothetical protein